MLSKQTKKAILPLKGTVGYRFIWFNPINNFNKSRSQAAIDFTPFWVFPLIRFLICATSCDVDEVVILHW